MRDVAAVAGVSLSTVSRVVNGGLVDAAMARRVCFRPETFSLADSSSSTEVPPVGMAKLRVKIPAQFEIIA